MTQKIASSRLLPVVAALLSVEAAWADSGFWSNPAGGSLANAANWDPGAGIAQGADSTAYFGLSLEPSLSPNATFTLDGSYTIGNLYFTPQTGSGHLALNPGAGGSLTLDATYNAPTVTVSQPDLQVTLNTIVAGNEGLTKDGPGTLVLAAANTYSGPTTINGGTLRVDGRIGSGGVSVRNGTLGGSGAINGPVTVQQGGTFSPGPTVSALNLQSGSAVQVDVDATSASSDQIQGLASIAYGGTLLVNLTGSPTLGERFQIFGASSASGNFSGITPPPAPGLLWRFDPATGTLSVVSAAARPQIFNLSLHEGKFTLLATNGPPGVAGCVLTTPDPSLPLGSWTALATNSFDVSGNASFTCAATPDPSARFYIISTPVTP